LWFFKKKFKFDLQFLTAVYFIRDHFVYFFIKLHIPCVFLSNFIFIFYCFCKFFIDIFLPNLSFKIKLVENYDSRLNSGQRFYRIRLLEIISGLRGLPGFLSLLLVFFFPFSGLVFFLIFFYHILVFFSVWFYYINILQFFYISPPIYFFNFCFNFFNYNLFCLE
jgi:hypothetical protein